MICNRTQAVAEADLQHMVSRRRMDPIDALTPDERRELVWGDDYDACAGRRLSGSHRPGLFTRPVESAWTSGRGHLTSS